MAGALQPGYRLYEVLWVGDMGDVYVRFGPGDSVYEVRFAEAEPCTHNLVEIARWRLGRLKERWLP
jgi:hypothetical protein